MNSSRTATILERYPSTSPLAIACLLLSTASVNNSTSDSALGENFSLFQILNPEVILWRA